jgi:hypothetical protein
MPIPFTGGCLCGQIRYECSAEPVFGGNCHCRDCQKTSGSAYSPVIFVPSSAVKISGDVKYFESDGDSGHSVSRGFCPNCGSQLFGRPEMAPGMMGIRAGSLDDPTWFNPVMDIYTASAQPWDFMNPDLQKFAQLPPRVEK